MKSRWPIAALVATILFGALLRVYRLHTIPPGLFFDEAANLFDISSILQGARPLYFPANNGREPFFFYWASLFASIWGLTPYAIRLASAVVGVLTLPATFFCAREACRAWDRDRRWADWTAVAATFVLSITYLHLHYSRIGLRTISLPFFLALSFGFLLRGLRRDSRGSLLCAGLLGGLSVYTYISSRLAPALLAVPPLALARQGRFRGVLGQVVLVGIIWAVVSVPLGIYYLQHSREIEGHTDDISIFNPANNHGDPVGALLRGVVLTLGAFDVAGSGAAEQNLPNRPLLDPILSLFFVVGLATLGFGVFGSRRPSNSLRPVVALLLVAWIIDQAVPAMLSVSPPSFVRITGLLPVVATVVGFGISASYQWLARHVRPAQVVPGIVAGALALSTAWTVRDYFVVWGPSPEAYTFMMANKVDAASYLAGLARQDRVFLAPLWAQDNTVKFMTRGVAIESFDIGQGLVVPTDQSHDVHYVFPASDSREAAFVAQELPTTPSLVTVSDPANGFPLLIRLDVRAENLPRPPPAIATFGDGISLVGASVDQPRPRPGSTSVLTLVWLATKPQLEDYTVFIHARDASNATVAQSDGQPAADSRPTTSWRAGDMVWDRHPLTLPPTLRPGQYRLVAGLYQRATLHRLPAQIAAGRADCDEVDVGGLEVTVP